ncbi:MAG: alkaline phosphatase family protein [Methanosarcinales archaeon]
MKVLVIGLDGATWDLIRPWAENGILPNLNFLRKNGVYGNLTSTIPPVTVPAWISFVTGKNPGKIGCYDFLTPRKSLNNLRPITSKDIHGKTFYEILDENGKKCIILNLPGTYPPRIKEIVITSLLTQGDNFIFPPELIHEIPQLKNWRLVSDRSLYVNGKIIEYINDFRNLEKTRFEGAKELIKKKAMGFLFFVI